MNTIRSTWLGWGVLIAAGGGSYFFAKRSINADRKARHEADQQRRRLTDSLENSHAYPRDDHRSSDHASNPSGEASQDPAPASHAPGNGGSRKGKSKYEPAEPYRAKKGDRFS